MNVNPRWLAVGLAVVGWETLAYATRERVPFLTTVVHRLPRPARYAVAGGAAAMVFDHLTTRRVF